MEVKLKERLDVLLIQKNLAESREKAKEMIKSGNVLVNGRQEVKAGSTFPEDVEIKVTGSKLNYVSRGGLKLEKAIHTCLSDLRGLVCMDVGSSTGGFTDCMLQNGAAKVYAVDVGTDQLAEKLRCDERVISMEKTNIRYLHTEEVGEKMDFISIDVAFISLTKILIPVKNLLKENGEIVCLIKPQFEAGRENIGKKGVVREKNVHVQVIESLLEYVNSIGFEILQIDFSPVKGPEGNIEYLLYIRKMGTNAVILTRKSREEVVELVNRSHEQVGQGALWSE